MRRTIKELLSFDSVKHLIYLPGIILKLKNWPLFLLNYIGLKNTGGLYVFRDETRILTKEGCESGNITVIFFKKDYGDIRDGSLVIDIGANNGVFSIYSAVTSKNTTVYAYEPMPETYLTLVENVELNKLEKNIFPFNLGIASRRGARELFVGGGSPYNSLLFSDRSKSLKIDCISLEDVFEENKLDRCDILKIDCEGAEFEILYNASEGCLSRIKEIRMEYHNMGSFENYNIDDLIRFLTLNGFELVNFRKPNLGVGIAWFRRA